MDCGEARATLWPPERPKLVGGAVEAARRHVETCTDCEAFLAQDRAVLEAYERIRQLRAPLAVRERVFQTLAHARRRSAGAASLDRMADTRRPSALWWGLAAAGLAYLWLAPGPVPAPAEGSGHGAAAAASMFVEDYLRRAVSQDHIETSSPEEVARFLRRELGITVRPLSAAGLRLVRAEICLLEGKRGAMIVYRQGDAEISHYLIPREGTRPRRPRVSPRGAEGNGVPVVTWSTGQVEQALVGEVPSQRLLRLAAESGP